ncbi:3-oxo-Delta(45)-steroid 5-beta-reductase protein [Rutstroemia sp. NJR-2017a BBW]|nr:3-oxo-Delta(45)-steroid 5-beta-reductase protein [Rutstroemia sp. NJR-2017a BBW]
MSSRQALIFGASGISGWALARECLKYPSEDTFNRVIALSNQRLLKEEFLLSETDASRLDLHAGIDLSKGVDDSDLQQQFSSISGIKETTHVYYTAYGGHRSDHSTLTKINETFFMTALSLVSKNCPRIQFFSLQTGGKTYGFEFYGQPGMPWNPPHKESNPRLPEPYRSKVFYYPQVDALTSAAMTHNWKFCEVRPEIIVGFTPRSNGMGMAQALGIFLSLYRYVRSEGSEVIFPGDEAMWNVPRTDTSQDTLARFHIYASLNPEKTSGRAFNVADEDGGSTWKNDWPRLCSYFGLKGVGPDATNPEPKGLDWLMVNQEQWIQWMEKAGLRDIGQMNNSSWDMLKVVLEFLPMDRRMDITESKRIGFGEQTETVDGYFQAWDRMKKAKIIA